MGSLVVDVGDVLEPLLAGGVPHLELDDAASLFDGPDLEVDADGGEEGGVEDVVGEPEEEAGLANGGVADDDDLEDEVVVSVGHMELNLLL